MDVAVSLSKLLERNVTLYTSMGNFRGIVSKLDMREAEVLLMNVTNVCNNEKLHSRIVKLTDIRSIKSADRTCILPAHLSDRLPVDVVTIDTMDSEFHDAIRHLKRQYAIGVSVESAEVSRYIEIQWICFSTPSCTFLFDIQKLGREAFSQGLKFILEFPKIEKVFHDCRRASDCLYHQYNTKLDNVYDTQLAEFLSHAKGSLTDKVNTIDHCLRKYLKVPSEYLYFPCNVDQRPITDTLQNLLVKGVIYLRLLKSELDTILKIPFRRCVLVYLQCIQKLSHQDFKIHQADTTFIPAELTESMQVLKIPEHIDLQLCPHKSGKTLNPYQKYEFDCEKYKNQLQSESPTLTNELYPTDNLIDNINKSEIFHYLMSKMCNVENNSIDDDVIAEGEISENSIDKSDFNNESVISNNECISSKKIQPPASEHLNKSFSARLKDCLNKYKLSSESETKSCLEQTKFDSVTTKTHHATHVCKVPKESSSTNSCPEYRNRAAVYNRFVDENGLLTNGSVSIRAPSSESSLIASLPRAFKLSSRTRAESKREIKNPKHTSDTLSPLQLLKGSESASDKPSLYQFSSDQPSQRKAFENEELNISAASVVSLEREHTFKRSENCQNDALSSDTSDVLLMDKSRFVTHSAEPDNEDPWKRLRSAFADLGPVPQNKTPIFIPAGMQC